MPMSSRWITFNYIKSTEIPSCNEIRTLIYILNSTYARSQFSRWTRNFRHSLVKKGLRYAIEYIMADKASKPVLNDLIEDYWRIKNGVGREHDRETKWLLADFNWPW